MSLLGRFWAGLIGEQQTTRSASDHARALEVIQQLDTDGDGKISKKELVEHIQEFVAVEAQKRLMRRMLVATVVVAAMLIVLITLVVVSTSLSSTKTWVTVTDGGNLFTRYTFGTNTKEAVATGQAVQRYEVWADSECCEALTGRGAFQKRPLNVVVFLEDGTVLDFPPETLQAFSCGARMSHSSLGVSLVCACGSPPTVEYHGGADGLSMRARDGLPSGPYELAVQQARQPSLVTKLQLLEPESVAVALLNPWAEAPSNASLAPPLEAEAAKKAERAALTRNIKVLLPLNTQPSEVSASATAAVVRGDPNSYELIGCNDSATVRAVCLRFEAGDGFSGTCGFNASGDFESRFAAIAYVDITPLLATLDQVNLFREAMRDEGETCFSSVQKTYHVLVSGVGRTVAPREDPDHAELQRSVRRLIAATPGGRALGAAKAAELLSSAATEPGFSEEEHRRQLAPSWYSRTGKITDHVTCYRVSQPGWYRGSASTTCHDPETNGIAAVSSSVYAECSDKARQCIAWDKVLNDKRCRNPDPPRPGEPRPEKVTTASPVYKQIACICSLMEGVARPYPDRKNAMLAENFGRSHCKNLGPRYAHLEDVPVCFYYKPEAYTPGGTLRQSSVKYGLNMGVTKARVSACFTDYYRAARASYTCKSGCDYAPPYDPWFAWQLARVAKANPQYRPADDYESEFNSMTYSGTGVHVFVIDTGINRRHPDLAGRIGDGVNLVVPASPKQCSVSRGTMHNCEDAQGHGTHVAGIIAGARFGIARRVTIHPVRISEGRTGTFNQVSIDWIRNYMKEKVWRPLGNGNVGRGKTKAAAIVVFSQGLPPGHTHPGMDQLFRLLLDDGISVVTSAGNEYADACTTSPNRMDQTEPNKGLIVVGATNIDDSRGFYTNYGSCITVYAPGTAIISTAKYNTATRAADEYATFFGTSQACPVVAGIVALNAQRLLVMNINPTPRKMRDWLVSTALSGKVKRIDASVDIPNYAQTLIQQNRDYSSNFWQDVLITPQPYVTSYAPGKRHVSNKLAHIPSHWLRALRRTRRLSLDKAAGAPPSEQLDAPHDKLGALVGRLLAEGRAADEPGDEPADEPADEPGDERGDERRLSEDEEPEGSGAPIGTCGATVRVYDELTPCPAADEVVCGDPTGVAPDGSVLQRPFRRVLTECAPGCVCEPATLAAVSYESCAASACDYTYTNEPCLTAFSISTADEAHHAVGLKLHYAPLPFSSGFNEPTVAYRASIEERYAGAEGGEIVAGGVRYRFAAPTLLDLADEASVLVSVRPAEGLASSIPFLGQHYTAFTVASNGYVGFGAPPDSVASEATAEAQFSAERGPAFSLLLADLQVPSAYVAHVERVSHLTDANGTQTSEVASPYATVVTYKAAEVATFDTEVGVRSATAQAFFEHETGHVTLVIGAIPLGIAAVIGPSDGAGAGSNTLTSLGGLLNGTHVANATNALCDEAAQLVEQSR